jgi:hypothetical protein
MSKEPKYYNGQILEDIGYPEEAWAVIINSEWKNRKWNYEFKVFHESEDDFIRRNKPSIITEEREVWKKIKQEIKKLVKQDYHHPLGGSTI